MFRFRLEERLTIEEVLGSEWMVRWVLPLLKTPPLCATS